MPPKKVKTPQRLSNVGTRASPKEAMEILPLSEEKGGKNPLTHKTESGVKKTPSNKRSAPDIASSSESEGKPKKNKKSKSKKAETSPTLSSEDYTGNKTAKVPPTPQASALDKEYNNSPDSAETSDSSDPEWNVKDDDGSPSVPSSQGSTSPSPRLRMPKELQIICNVPVPLTASDPVHEVLNPYIALGFCPTGHREATNTERQESGVCALHTAWYSACEYLGCLPYVEHSKVKVSDFLCIYKSPEYKKGLKAMYKGSDIGQKLRRDNKIKYLAEKKKLIAEKWMDMVEIYLLLQMVNQEFKTNFILGFVTKGYRIRYDGEGKEWDAAFVQDTFATLHNNEEETGDPRPCLWIWCDNGKAKCQAWCKGKDEADFEDYYEGFAAPVRSQNRPHENETRENAQEREESNEELEREIVLRESGRKEVQDWEIEKRVKEDVEGDIWRLDRTHNPEAMKIYIKKEKSWKLLPVWRGHFVRRAFRDRNEKVPEGYEWMRLSGTQAGTHGEPYDDGLVDETYLTQVSLHEDAFPSREALGGEEPLSAAASSIPSELKRSDIEKFMGKTDADFELASIYLENIEYIRMTPEELKMEMAINVYLGFMGIAQEVENKKAAEKAIEKEIVDNQKATNNKGKPEGEKRAIAAAKPNKPQDLTINHDPDAEAELTSKPPKSTSFGEPSPPLATRFKQPLRIFLLKGAWKTPEHGGKQRNMQSPLRKAKQWKMNEDEMEHEIGEFLLLLRLDVDVERRCHWMRRMDFTGAVKKEGFVHESRLVELDDPWGFPSSFVADVYKEHMSLLTSTSTVSEKAVKAWTGRHWGKLPRDYEEVQDFLKERARMLPLAIVAGETRMVESNKKPGNMESDVDEWKVVRTLGKPLRYGKLEVLDYKGNMRQVKAEKIKPLKWPFGLVLRGSGNKGLFDITI